MCVYDKPQLNKLQDLKRNGNAIEWRVKKMDSLRLSESLARIGLRQPVLAERFKNRSDNMGRCAKILEFEESKDGSVRKLVSAFFCYNPLCPVCTWRRSQKLYGQVNKVVDYLDSNSQSYKYIMLTLTVRNVPGEDLDKTMDRMQKGWERFSDYAPWLRMCKGFIRHTEVTYNWQRKDFHPHMHILIAVDPRYLDDKLDYITHEKFISMWRKAMRLDYDPSVFVSMVVKKKRNRSGREHAHKNGSISWAGAIAEISKYSSKPGDYMAPWDDYNARLKFTHDTKQRDSVTKELIEGTGIVIRSRKHSEELTDSVVKWLDIAFTRRRRISMGGVFKEAHSLLNLDNPEEGDLINTDGNEEEPMETETSFRTIYRWDRLYRDHLLWRVYMIVNGEKHELSIEEYIQMSIESRARAPD